MRNSCKAKSRFRSDLFYSWGEESWEKFPWYCFRCCAYSARLWWQMNEYAALAEWQLIGESKILANMSHSHFCTTQIPMDYTCFLFGGHHHRTTKEVVSVVRDSHLNSCRNVVCVKCVSDNEQYPTHCGWIEFIHCQRPLGNYESIIHSVKLEEFGGGGGWHSGTVSRLAD
jgi:hypothetical protein